MTVPPSDILKTQAVMTMVGGTVVFERGTGTPSARVMADRSSGGRARVPTRAEHCYGKMSTLCLPPIGLFAWTR